MTESVEEFLARGGNIIQLEEGEKKKLRYYAAWSELDQKYLLKPNGKRKLWTNRAKCILHCATLFAVEKTNYVPVLLEKTGHTLLLIEKELHGKYIRHYNRILGNNNN